MFSIEPILHTSTIKKKRVVYVTIVLDVFKKETIPSLPFVLRKIKIRAEAIMSKAAQRGNITSVIKSVIWYVV